LKWHIDEIAAEKTATFNHQLVRETFSFFLIFWNVLQLLHLCDISSWECLVCLCEIVHINFFFYFSCLLKCFTIVTY
jgi:hypothetical protein